MRIGIFTDTYPPDINGVATACELLASELRKLGHTVYVITTNLAGENKVSVEGDLIRIPGVVLKSIYSYRMAGPFSSRVYSIIKKLDLDLVHVHTEYGIGIFGRLVARMRNISIVYTYHSLYEDFTYLISKGRKVADATLKAAITSLSRSISETPTEIITPTVKTADALRSYGVDRYIYVIPDGVDLTDFSPTERTREEGRALRERLGLNGKRVLSVVGRIGQEKGIDSLLDGLRRYIDVYSDESVRLLIVGDGPYLKEIERRISALWLDRYVTFTGKLPHSDIPACYQASDILLSGSRSETQGLTVNEAMASGCLVLARRDPSFFGAIEDGVTGFFFSDPDSFAESLHRIFLMDEVDKDRIREAAKARTEERYSPPRCTLEVEHVYREALRKYW